MEKLNFHFFNSLLFQYCRLAQFDWVTVPCTSALWFVGSIAFCYSHAHIIQKTWTARAGRVCAKSSWNALGLGWVNLMSCIPCTVQVNLPHRTPTIHISMAPTPECSPFAIFLGQLAAVTPACWLWYVDTMTTRVVLTFLWSPIEWLTLVDMLLFSVEKIEFPLFEIPYFRVLPSILAQHASTILGGAYAVVDTVGKNLGPRIQPDICVHRPWFHRWNHRLIWPYDSTSDQQTHLTWCMSQCFAKWRSPDCWFRFLWGAGLCGSTSGITLRYDPMTEHHINRHRPIEPISLTWQIMSENLSQFDRNWSLLPLG